MNEVSIIEEFLKCLQQISQLDHLNHLKMTTTTLTVAMVHSNFLLFAYFINALMIKRSCYLVAFLFAECITKLELFNSTGAVNFYLQLALVAFFIYWVGRFINFTTKALICYVIIGLFLIMMAGDEYLYSPNITFLYENYASIIVVLHLFIIASTFNYERIRAACSRFFVVLGAIWRNSYTFGYIWYNLQQIPQPKTKKCQ